MAGNTAPTEANKEPVQRIIEGFDHKAFAQNLVAQATPIIPNDLTDEDKKFIADIIYKFCFLSGDALVKDETVTFDAAQAALITQFIGEWSFHKSIDLVKSNIEMKLRESVLQRIAFTVFEIAKQAVVKKMPQDQMIPLVEHHVNECYKNALADLAKKGLIDEQAQNKAMSQSNIDAMAKVEAAQEDSVGSDMSDSKILKLASLALLMKNFSDEKKNNILSKFKDPEREVLGQYLKMEGLETKIDKSITKRCLGEIKQALPESTTLSYEKIHFRLSKIIKNMPKNEISNIMIDERPLLKEYVDGFSTGVEVLVPQKIAAVIYQHIEEKIS